MSSPSLRRSVGLALSVCFPAAALSVVPAAAVVAAAPASVPQHPAASPAAVATEPVTPTVTTHDLDRVDSAARERVTGRIDETVALSPPQPVHGYATVGLTWDRRSHLGDATMWVRTYDGTGWSSWQEAEAEDDDAPDPGTAEARGQHPGTEPLVVGDVRKVQAKVLSRRRVLPAGLALAVVDSGTSQDDTTVAAPAFGPARSQAATRRGTPAPRIFTRKQWGADESLRSGNPSYGTVQATVVHHTVNGNDYSKAEVPGIVRSIYAYHTQVRGWSDIGYNVLVDRFGRLWEGRYGGLKRAVVGAHALNFNGQTFGISAIGNFETVRPTKAMQDAIARTVAWKLDRAGRGTLGTATVNGHRMHLVSGHRDVGSTACPGEFLFARLPAIRELAASYQDEEAEPAPGGRTLRRSVNRDDRPDVVVRQEGTLRALLGDAGPGFAPAIGVSAPAGRFDVATGVGDLDGDGRGDVLVRRSATGAFEVRASSGPRSFGAVVNDGGGRFATALALTGSPDLTGDGLPDLLVTTDTGDVKVAAGNESTGFAVARRVSRDWAGYRAVLGAGDLDRDGIGDLLLIDQGGVLWLAGGQGELVYAEPVRLGGGWQRRTRLAAGHDLTGDRIPDLLATVTSTGRTWIWPGDGNGGFGKPIGGWTGWDDNRMVTTTTDVDGDGFADAVVVDAGGRMSTRPSRHGMWLRPGATIAGSWSSYRWLALAGDWDGDGLGDLVGVQGDKLWLLRGKGNGRYHPRVGGWSGWRKRYHLMAADDWSGDGRPDLLSKRADGTVLLHPGRGRSGTAAPRVVGRVGRVAAITVVGRWNGDRFPDLVTRGTGGRLTLWPGRGTKPPAAGVTLLGGRGFGRYDRIIGVGDLTGDGRPDLLARSSRQGAAWIVPGSRKSVGQRIPVAGGWGSYSLIG